MINLLNYSTENHHRNKVSFPKMVIPAFGLMCAMSTTPMKADTFEKCTNNIELADTTMNVTKLTADELAQAPSPKITIAGKETTAGIVVEVESNKLYRYDESGKIIDGYNVATGAIGKNGKSLTHTGIRSVHHIETYPYREARGSKRSRSPKAYGPKILYLTTIDPNTGKNLGSNGEFIHGNNNPQSIGKHASHGCIRMDNEVIKMLAQKVKIGTKVLIK